jgi:hypothetical protein
MITSDIGNGLSIPGSIEPLEIAAAMAKVAKLLPLWKSSHNGNYESKTKMESAHMNEPKILYIPQIK